MSLYRHTSRCWILLFLALKLQFHQIIRCLVCSFYLFILGHSMGHWQDWDLRSDQATPGLWLGWFWCVLWVTFMVECEFPLHFHILTEGQKVLNRNILVFGAIYLLHYLDKCPLSSWREEDADCYPLQASRLVFWRSLRSTRQVCMFILFCKKQLPPQPRLVQNIEAGSHIQGVTSTCWKSCGSISVAGGFLGSSLIRFLLKSLINFGGLMWSLQCLCGAIFSLSIDHIWPCAMVPSVSFSSLFWLVLFNYLVLLFPRQPFVARG